jgi:pimeloyl-ACP methyl ester carboxylesterase
MNRSKLNEFKLGRSFLSAIAIAFVVMLVANIPVMAREAARNTGALPSIVLVHGAFADPSGWNEVAARLQRDGYSTTAVTLGGISVAGDVAIVQSTLDGIPGNKLLVAHSYGGFVISNAAFGRSDVLGLVYTTGYIPDEGDSLSSLNDGYQLPAWAAPGHLQFTPFPFAIINPIYFRDDFAQDLNPKLAASLSAGQIPVNLGVLGTPSGPVAWHNLPTWYAVSAMDRIIDPALQRWMAQRAGATIIEFDDASHAGGFTHYATRFVDLIEDAVQATAG